MMKIEKNKVVTMDFAIVDSDGTVIDTSIGKEPFAFIFGIGAVIPGLEQALNGLNTGDSLTVTIQPAQAYGTHNKNLIEKIDRSDLGDIGELTVGAQYQVPLEDGIQFITILKIEGDIITVDGNHPLAGKTLTYDVKIIDVRDATAKEISQGYIAS